jgi:hypothetical protein
MKTQKEVSGPSPNTDTKIRTTFKVNKKARREEKEVTEES